MDALKVTAFCVRHAYLLNRLNLYTILFAYSWRVRKSLFYFYSPYGLCVTYVCLRCGRRKQNCCHFFSKTAFIHPYTSDYRAKTKPWSICQSMVNIVSQITTLQTTPNGSYGCECKHLQFIFSIITVQIDSLLSLLSSTVIPKLLTIID